MDHSAGVRTWVLGYTCTDDLFTMAFSDKVLSQFEVIHTFTQDTHFNLNISKLAAVTVSKTYVYQPPKSLTIAGTSNKYTSMAAWVCNRIYQCCSQLMKALGKQGRRTLCWVVWVFFMVTLTVISQHLRNLCATYTVWL